MVAAGLYHGVTQLTEGGLDAAENSPPSGVSVLLPRPPPPLLGPEIVGKSLQRLCLVDVAKFPGLMATRGVFSFPVVSPAAAPSREAIEHLNVARRRLSPTTVWVVLGYRRY